MKEKDDYEDKSQNIRNLAALPPNELAEYLSELHPNIGTVAPNITPHIFATAANSIAYLNSKLPNAGNELPQDKFMPPSKAQKNAWFDIYETVNNPLSVLKHVKNNTLNRHHVEALQAVYPDLHKEMTSKIAQELGEAKMKGKLIPYQRRLSISRLTGIPVDSTMTVPNMQAIIKSASVNTGPEATSPARRGNTGTAISQINKVNDIYPTELQSRELQKQKLKLGK
jgi:hypothetical protein